MLADRKEWEELQMSQQQNRGKVNGADAGRVLEMLQQASIKQENMTTDQNWNYYLTLIQGWIDKTRENAIQFRSALESPDLVNVDQRKQLENYLLQCNERISILDAVIALPNQIMKSFEDAKLELQEIGKDNIETEDKLDI